MRNGGARKTVLLAVAGLALASIGSAPAAAQDGDVLEVVVTEVWSTPGDPGFGFPRGMAQWPDGTVWVGDQQVAEVSEISPDGSAVRVVLRDGDGPREVVRAATRIVSRPGGGMFVWDAKRVGFFGPEKNLERYRPPPLQSPQPGNMAATPDGGLVLATSWGHDPDHKLARFAVHRFDSRLKHQRSWHPVARHRRWDTVRYTSGGPLAVTRDGGLLVLDHAPFRITRYADLDGADPRVVVEDERIVSSAELDRAVTYGPGSRKSFGNWWTRSSFVHELEDGNILAVVSFFPERGTDERVQTIWLVVSPEGVVLGRTSVMRQMEVWRATPDGAFLATYWDGPTQQHFAAKFEVEFVPKEPRP